jgi:hypothetical protein
MSFQIQIIVDSIEEAERVLARVGEGNPPAAVLSSDHQRAGEALQQLLARHDGDMTKPVEVLRRFGANSVRDLPPGDCGTFVAACAAA